MDDSQCQGRPKALGDARCTTEILGCSGTEIKKWGTKFKFGQLILRKIINIVATICQNAPNSISDGSWVCTPDPSEGAHSAPPDPIAGFKRSYF